LQCPLRYVCALAPELACFVGNEGGTLRFNGQVIPEGKIPYVTLGQLTELEAEEAELSENIHRVDLTWQERAAVTARLAKLRIAQAEAEGRPAPVTADIAKEVAGSDKGVHHENTRRDIILAKHMDKPEVAQAKDRNEAWKALLRKEQQNKSIARAVEVGRTYSAASHRLLQEDSKVFFETCDAESFDLILTDPIYGMGADEFGDSGGVTAGAHEYDDSYETWRQTMSWFCVESFRVAKAQAHAYVFCDVDRFPELKLWMAEAGWKVFRTPFIWHKPGGSRLPWVTAGPQRKYELILYAMKGDRPVNKIKGDVLSYPADTNLGHNAQKPVALYRDLIDRSCQAGDTILDPFGGSGPIIPAATDAKCLVTYVERDPKSYGIAVQRLNDLI